MCALASPSLSRSLCFYFNIRCEMTYSVIYQNLKKNNLLSILAQHNEAILAFYNCFCSTKEIDFSSYIQLDKISKCLPQIYTPAQDEYDRVFGPIIGSVETVTAGGTTDNDSPSLQLTKYFIFTYRWMLQPSS